MLYADWQIDWYLVYQFLFSAVIRYSKEATAGRRICCGSRRERDSQPRVVKKARQSLWWRQAVAAEMPGCLLTF